MLFEKCSRSLEVTTVVRQFRGKRVQAFKLNFFLLVIFLEVLSEQGPAHARIETLIAPVLHL